VGGVAWGDRGVGVSANVSPLRSQKVGARNRATPTAEKVSAGRVMECAEIFGEDAQGGRSAFTVKLLKSNHC
jgi:hypothetical protein